VDELLQNMEQLQKAQKEVVERLIPNLLNEIKLMK
jgi:hypothetical protein